MKKRLIAVLMPICILLSACSAPAAKDTGTSAAPESQTTEENTGSDVNTEKVWSLNQIEMPNPDDALEETVIPEGFHKSGEKWRLVGETVYRFFFVKSDSETPDYLGAYVQTLQKTYTKWENHPISLEDWVEGENCTPWSYNFAQCFSADGSIYALLHGQECDYMGRWSMTEGCSAVKIESDWLTESFFDYKIPQIMISGEGLGNYFLYNDYDAVNNQLGDYQEIWLDAEYQPQKGLPDIAEGFVYELIPNPFSDNIYLCGTDSDAITVEGDCTTYLNEGFTIWTPDEKDPIFTTQDTGMLIGDNVVFYSGTEGYFWNSGGIWQFSIEEQSIKLIFNTADMDYVQDMIFRYGAFVREDGALLMLSAGTSETNSNHYFLWEMTGETETEKQILELATTIPGSELQKAVVAFNKQSDAYKIVLRTPKEEETFEDFRTRIQAELAAGGGPDLLFTGAAIDLDAGAQKRYLLDLSEYFAEYENDILPSVWQTGQADGKLYAVPHTCQIITLVTSSDVVGRQTGWTLQEAMEYMEKSDAVSFANRENAAGLFYKLGLISESNTNFIDWEQNVSHLNSDEAVKLLEFSVKYADDESTIDNQYQRIASGEVLTLVLYLFGPDAIHSAISMFGNKEVYIGFPTEDGKSGTLITGESIAVNQACPNTEGAVEFLKFLLSDTVQLKQAENLANGRSFSGFPVTEDALEQFFSCLQNADEIPESLYSSGGIEYQVMPLSDEKIEILRELFRTARPMSERAENLMPIIEEELSSYMSGNKSAKEVLDIVQNRTQLYMDEVR